MDGQFIYEKNSTIDVSNVKMIILDLDGTLYDLSKILKKLYTIQCEFFSSEMEKTLEETEHIFRINGIMPKVCDKSKSATAFFEECGMDVQKWNNMRNTYSYIEDIDISTAVSNQQLSHLKKYYQLALLSSNTRENVLDVLQKLKVDKSLFRFIICSSDVDGKYRKKDCLINICDICGISTSEIISIGDRLQTDIIPLVEEGSIGILVRHPKYFKDIEADLMRFYLNQKSPYYKVYTK